MIGAWNHPVPYFHSDTETVRLWPSFYTIPWKLQCLEDYDSDQIAGNFKSNKQSACVTAGPNMIPIITFSREATKVLVDSKKTGDIESCQG